MGTINSKSQDLNFGMRWGIGINSLSTTTANTVATSLSFLNIAFILDKEFTNSFSLQSELQLISKGFKSSQTNGANAFTSISNYIGINFLPKLTLTDKNETMSFHLLAGPSANFNAKSYVTAGSVNEDYPSDMINQFDLSACFGGGLGFKVNDGKLFFEGRYNLPFTNFIKTSGVPANKQTQLGIHVGYIVPIGENEDSSDREK